MMPLEQYRPLNGGWWSAAGFSPSHRKLASRLLTALRALERRLPSLV